MRMVGRLVIVSLVWCLLLVLVIDRRISLFPQFTEPPAASCSAYCRSGYQEEYRSGGGDNHHRIVNNRNTQSSSKDHYHSNARSFRGHGCAAHLFAEFGAYRGGNKTFSILGLASKPLHTYGNPSFSCEWIPSAVVDATTDNVNDSKFSPLEGTVTKDYPDYGYGRAYTVVVITCKFDVGVGTDGNGGQLILHAYHGDAMGREERIVALSEKPGVYKASLFDPPYPYDFLYCGSPLFGKLNEQRVREWIAYHDMVFGERSHFVLYDAGGIHDGVREALLPWIQLGRVSVQDIRSTVHFDGYYYNQFLMVNDCLQRSRFLANWTFFFDLDEYLYVQPPHTLHSLLAERYHRAPDASVTEVSFTQYRMVKHLCHSPAAAGAPHPIENTSRQWAFEKLTYRDLFSSNRDVKYVCNPREVYATGVHGVQHIERGRQERFNDTVVRYYHYHGIIDMEDERDLCKELSKDIDSAHNFTQAAGQGDGGGTVVQYDATMVPFILMAKKHEIEALQKTRQKVPHFEDP